VKYVLLTESETLNSDMNGFEEFKRKMLKVPAAMTLLMA
jgi:hypothetical protein